MVLDTSAVLAVLQNEPERDAFIDRIAKTSQCRISAASYVEAGIVLEARYGSGGRHQMIVFLAQVDVRVEPVTEEQARIALDAYHRFGKGHHAAGLNYGDCFAYALAVSQAEELLYKGTDFAATDLAD